MEEAPHAIENAKRFSDLPQHGAHRGLPPPALRAITVGKPSGNRTDEATSEAELMSHAATGAWKQHTSLPKHARHCLERDAAQCHVVARNRKAQWSVATNRCATRALEKLSTECISISIAEKCLFGSGVLQPRKTQKRCFHQEVQETETGDVEEQQQRQSSRFNKPQTLRGASGAHLGAKQTPEITVSTIFQSREAARQPDTYVQQEDRRRHSSFLQAFDPPAADSGNV